MKQNNGDGHPRDIGEFAEDFIEGTPKREGLKELLKEIYFSRDNDREERAQSLIRDLQIGPYLIFDWHIKDERVNVTLYEGTGKTDFAYVYTLNGNEKKGQKRNRQIRNIRNKSYLEVEESD